MTLVKIKYPAAQSPSLPSGASLKQRWQPFLTARYRAAAKSLLVSCLAFLLASCGGDDRENIDDPPVDMSGDWRGNLTLMRNGCALNLARNFNFEHSVYQDWDEFDLYDETSRRFSGDLVGEVGFSVDTNGPRDEPTQDGRVCNFTLRYRYNSIRRDDDSTAEVRFFYIGECSDGSVCESEFAGDGKR